MTLDEAIKLLTAYCNEEEVALVKDFDDAAQLGLEALKAWKDKRLFSNRLAYYLLPGETEKKKGVKDNGRR